jgi:hypothetical protein
MTRGSHSWLPRVRQFSANNVTALGEATASAPSCADLRGLTQPAMRYLASIFNDKMISCGASQLNAREEGASCSAQQKNSNRKPGIHNKEFKHDQEKGKAVEHYATKMEQNARNGSRLVRS